MTAGFNIRNNQPNHTESVINVWETLKGGYRDSGWAGFLATREAIPPMGVKYNFVLKDHFDERAISAVRQNQCLGDIETSEPRSGWAGPIVFSDANNDGTVSNDEVLSEHHYYPFGMEMNGEWSANTLDYNYTYNGKENQRELGLGYLNYGARFYDASIGRFTGVDPVSDQFSHLSTFNYASNDPVSKIDVWGLQGLHHSKTDKDGNTTHFIEKNVVVLLEKMEEINEDDSEKRKKRKRRRNKRREKRNKKTLEKIEKELNSYYGTTTNEDGESVEFNFNLIGVEVENRKDEKVAKELSNEHKLLSSMTLPSGSQLPVFAAVITKITSGGDHGETTGHIVREPNPQKADKYGNNEGTIAHEIGHLLNLKDNYLGTGVMASPPRRITPSEVSKVISKSRPR